MKSSYYILFALFLISPMSFSQIASETSGEFAMVTSEDDQNSNGDPVLTPIKQE